MSYCTHCGASLEGVVNFCKNCGGKLDGAKAPGVSVASQIPTPAETTNRKKLAIIIGAGVAVVALALVLILTVFLNKPEAEQPLTVAELLELGEKYLLDLDYEQALVQYLAVIEVEPRNERAYIGAAKAYLGLGDTDRAAQILQEGLDKTGNAEIGRLLERLPDGLIMFGGYLWRLLDEQDGKQLVVSEYLFSEYRNYHNIPEGVDIMDVEITWADSSMRTYLNGEFYNSFNEVDRARIVQTNVVNSNNPWYGTNGGVDTQDYIFLLSIDEVLRYFGDSGRLAFGEGNKENDDHWWGISDEYNEARIAYDMGTGTASWWWLRSPGGHPYHTADVNSIAHIGIGGRPVSSEPPFGGVRPAMWITLE